MAPRVLTIVVVILPRCRWYCHSDADGTNDGRDTAEEKDDFDGNKLKHLSFGLPVQPMKEMALLGALSQTFLCFRVGV